MPVSGLKLVPVFADRIDVLPALFWRLKPDDTLSPASGILPQNAFSSKL